MTPEPMKTSTLTVDGAELAYDVRPVADSPHRPLLMFGHPMDAGGFAPLAGHLTDRTVITYDPRGCGRSQLVEGAAPPVPEDHVADLHALVVELGLGPVDVFASSGGAVLGLAWVASHPGDVATLVAHEPPLLSVLPDAALVERATDAMNASYRESGFGPAMAQFIVFTSWQGALTEEFFAQGPPDPASFGLPTEDDGSRDHPLFHDGPDAVTEHVPDLEALRASPTRIVVAAGEESSATVTGRAAAVIAQRLGTELTLFPSHHAGFSAEDGPFPGRATAFAPRLVEVLG